MYDRAVRTLTKPLTGTPAEVGPGSYESQVKGYKKYAKIDGYAPFLSMSVRESFLDVPDHVVVHPGPGQYESGAHMRIQGGSTLANRSGRFQDYGKDSTPGPGAYSLSKTSDWIKTKPIEMLQQPMTADGSVYKVTFQRKADPPSIPSPGQAFGYEEGFDGTLQRQKAPNHDSSLGPAFYKLNDKQTAPVEKYKGNHFSKRTSKREGAGDNLVPGPGSYDPFHEKEKAPIDFIIEEQRKKNVQAQLPRYHEIVSIVEEKKAVPGPGKYDIRSQFERAQSNEAVIRPSFGTQAKRFDDYENGRPAPGSYNDPRHALESVNRIAGLKKSPFGQTSTRFQKEHHVKRTPGPGAYNHNDISTEVRKKAFFSSTQKGGFGVTSQRNLPLNKKDEPFMPGPGHYLTVKSAPPTSRKKNAVFESTTARVAQLGSDPQTMTFHHPPPGSYEVAESFDKSQGRVLYPENQHEAASSKKHGGFLSSTKRFSQPRDVIVKKTNPDNPGPGEYNQNDPKIHTGKLAFKEERFKTKQIDVPGPGAYELSPLIQHSVLKSTYNATLNNPVAHALEEMTETRKSPTQPFFLQAKK